MTRFRYFIGFFLYILTLSSFAQDALNYGPFVFERDKGKPEFEIRTFDVDSFSGTFTIRIVNGQLEEGDRKYKHKDKHDDHKNKES